MTPRIRQRKAHGYTLIELMVSITLGLLIITAVTSSFITARQTFRTGEAMSDVQETGRYADYFMGLSIRNAGYVSDPRMQINPAEIFGISTAAIDESRPALFGWESAKPTFGGLGGGPITNAEARDALVVSFAGHDDRQVTTCLGKPSLANGELGSRRIARVFFYLARPAGEPIRNLNCTVQYFEDCGPELSGCGPGAPSQLNTQPILRGVEDMQIRYGVDSDGDFATNRWVNATQVTAAEDWESVTAVEVVLTVVSEQRTEAAGLNDRILDAGGNPETEGGVTERRVRRTFRNVYSIRNRLVM